MFLHALFDPVELRNEQQVILEEIRMYDDSPDEVEPGPVRAVGVGGKPARRTDDRLCADRDRGDRPGDDRRYMRERYTPDSVVLTAAGNVDHEAIAAQVRELFGR